MGNGEIFWMNNNCFYYTTQAVTGPITKNKPIKMLYCGTIFSKNRTGHCPEWSCTCLCFLQSCNKSLINQARSGPYWENICPWSFLYGPRCAQSVLSRPRADILPVRPSCLVNKMYRYVYLRITLSLLIFTTNSLQFLFFKFTCPTPSNYNGMNYWHCIMPWSYLRRSLRSNKACTKSEKACDPLRDL